MDEVRCRARYDPLPAWSAEHGGWVREARRGPCVPPAASRDDRWPMGVHGVMTVGVLAGIAFGIPIGAVVMALAGR